MEKPEERDSLLAQGHLEGWQLTCHPLIFSYGLSAFDEGIAFTLKVYRGKNWETIRRDESPAYGDPSLEAETAQEVD